MKTIIPDIMPNFDIEKENRKQEMRELSKKIFAVNVPFTDDEKKKLMEFLQEKWSQNYFLIYLSKQRTQGRFARSQKLLNDLAEILTLILTTAEQEKDYEAARNCMILSQTYYYEEKDKDKEKDNPDLKLLAKEKINQLTNKGEGMKKINFAELLKKNKSEKND